MSYSASPLTAPPGEVDRSQETYTPSSQRPRRVPPSGDVSPDGTRPWPRPATSSKVLVWGGIGIAAAAATAGAVLAVRAITGRNDDDDAVEAARERGRRHGSSSRGHRLGKGPARPRRSGPPPAPPSRFAGGPEAPMRGERPRLASGRRSGAGATGMLDDINHTIQEMTSGVRNLLDTVNAAMNGFRSVAQQAAGVVSEFREAADAIREAIDPEGRGRRTHPAGDGGRRARPDVVDLRGSAAGMDDSRSHRL